MCAAVSLETRHGPPESNCTTEHAMSINLDFLRKLRRLSLCEGVSTLLLFGVAMPLKYFANLPQAVSIVGMLHGILFICLAVSYTHLTLPTKA